MNGEITEAELLGWEDLDRAATPGPWVAEREELDEDFSDEEQDTAFFESIGPWEVEYHAALDGDDHERVEADAAIVIAYRSATPRLIAEVRRLRAELANGGGAR